MTLAQVATEIEKSQRAVELASSKLVKAGRLRYVGPQKGGHWEVLKGAQSNKLPPSLKPIYKMGDVNSLSEPQISVAFLWRSSAKT